MSFTLRAHAKINLTLEALGKRADGYHEITSVLQTIIMADTLSFELAESFNFSCSVPSLQSADNLVINASNLLRKATGCTKGASIHLTKEIPIAAGLGSGATDAAATLIGLDRLWELNLSPERLQELASNLGSDVAFFLYGGTALAKGRGERITPIPPALELWIVLLNPALKPISNKTGQLYSQLNTSHFTSGQVTERLVDQLHAGRDIDDSLLFNVFEQVAFNFFHRLSDYRSRFMEAGAKCVHIAGAGPTLFSLIPDKDQGEAMINILEADGLEAYLVHTVEAAPSISVGNRQC